MTSYLQLIDTSQRALINLAEPRIQKNDLLSIKVYSLSADPRTDIPYNLPETAAQGGSASTTGFLVDEKGNIEYPRIGLLHVEGLTKTELAQQVREKLSNVLNSPSVIVRFLNYRVTVLGEVKSPGTFSIPTERITLLEALGMAGDVTESGKRDTVKVAREVNGQIQIGYVPLTSGDLFRSPYFRLQQNDVVFVDQTRRKIRQQEQQSFAQQLGIATGILATIALVINIIR
ncbi:polysaccharide biosynthesis/export family protein [Flavisolibacter nicotianae]|uniref:polysaccharide biosynthesis/export family protein n=1 Tax=Flavisolibacter nicotianae TaxID=2364882 RepID=UPI0013C45397|nr:polysaccharide biosynthesis/export family protein [Flavisolibacter nicotianae]